MSFKYRFIISFVLLEIIFILLIVSVNFFTINNSSKKLTEDKINSNITFLNELLTVPITVYDLATLDNLVERTNKINYINSLIVLDSQEKVISKRYKFKYESINDFLRKKENRVISVNNETYKIYFNEIYEDNNLIGSFLLIFDLTENTKLIEENKSNTIFIIIIEILLSTLLSYIIGSKLTRVLTDLSSVAETIGKEEYIEIPYQKEKNEIGKLTRSLSQMQNSLSERKNKIKEDTSLLEKQKNELAEANKAKDEFLANISHEIRTPLNAIIGFSDILKRSKLNKEEHNQASIISKSANSLLMIINEILDFSKIESGKIEITPERNSFKGLVEEIHSLFSIKASEKEIIFKCDIDTDIPNYMLFDYTKTQQVISNLVSNAIKFTPNLGEVILTGKLLSKNKTAKLYIEIKDNGIGIPKNKQEMIFKAFSQADGSITKEYGGTGLGLSIIKKILKLMGSDIKVESKEGKGSKFFFEIELPILDNDLSQNIKDSKTNENTTFTGNILVAEDNIINQELMKAMLESLDLNVDFVNNGEEAILIYEEKEYDLIFMDINMPKCDGITATRVIRESAYKSSRKHIPIIALTANVINGDTKKYLDAGMDEHIGKPINFDKLKEVLNKYLN